MDFEEYLRRRNVPSENIEKMMEQKIDPEIVLLMPDEDLSKFIPMYGDRMAVVEFCRSFGKKKEKESKKKNAIKALQQTLGIGKKKRRSADENSDSSDDSHKKRGTMKRQGNKNAQRKSRQIEIGWLHKTSTEKSFTQRRNDKGGKARKVSVDKSSVKDDLLKIGKSLFFPNGMSKAGPEENFDFTMKDFQHSDIPENETVGDIYEKTKLSMLRVYLATSEKEDKPDKKTHKKDKVETIEILDTPDNNDNSLPDLFEHPVMKEITEEIRKTEENEDTIVLNFGPKLPNTTLSETIPWQEFQVAAQGSSTPLQNIVPDEAVAMLNEHSTIRAGPSTLYTDPASFGAEPVELIIRRGFAMSDMIDAFVHDTLLGVKDIPITIKRLLPTGEMEPACDLGGVLKDTLAEFWDDFYVTSTLGAKMKVPFLRTDFVQEKKWDAIGRILVAGYKIVQYFPVKLVPTFVRQIVVGSADTSGHKDEDVMKDYLDYLNPTEGETLSEALDNFDSVDKTELLEVLQDHETRRQPTRENIRKIVLELAIKELVQVPMFIIDIWIQHFRRSGILCTEDVNRIYEQCTPTAKRILRLFTFPENMSKRQADVSKYLKKFVLEVEETYLIRFLRFVTGSNMITCLAIKVQFNDLVGLATRPLGHTCENMLELPTSYESYPDFRSQFHRVLEHGVWVMDFA